MGTVTYDLRSGSSQANNYVDMRFYVITTSAVFTNIRPMLRATTKDSDGNTIAKPVRLRAYVNSTLVQTATVTVDSYDWEYYDIPLSVSAQPNDMVRLYVDWPNGGASCRWEYSSRTFVFGYTGNNTSSQTQTEVVNCMLSVTYAEVWTKDSQNDGYPYPIGMTNETFDFYEKDKNGYPKNSGVWKLDKNNDGYPWIVGYEMYTAAGYAAVVKSGRIQNARCVVFKDGRAVPANFKILRR